jgi:Transglycosylase SLT domain
MADNAKTKAIEYLRNLDGEHGLPKGTLENLWSAESNQSFSPDTTSAKGAKGAFQFMPQTAKELGVNPSDFKSAAKGAARYLQDSMEQFGGDLNLALASYNAGKGRVARTPFEALPYETRNYVQKINQGMAQGSMNRMLALAEKDPNSVPLSDIQQAVSEYSSRYGTLNDNQVAVLERIAPKYEAIQPKQPTPSTQVSTDKGAWSPEGMVEGLRQGASDIVGGLAKGVDIPLNAVAGMGNLISRGITGKDVYGYDTVQNAVKNSLPDNPLRDKVVSAINEGGIQALATAPLAGVKTGSQLAMELASGALSGAGGEIGQQQGGTAGSLIGATVGALTPYGAERITKAALQGAGNLAKPLVQKVEPYLSSVVPNLERQITREGGTITAEQLAREIPQGVKAPEELLQAAKVSPEDFLTAAKKVTPESTGVAERLAASNTHDIPLTAGELLGGSGREASNPYLMEANRLQNAETNLRASGAIGEQQQAALAFKEAQKQKIVEAAQKFTDAQPSHFETSLAPTATREERGAILRKSVEDSRNNAKESVKNLYNAAKEIDAPYMLDASPMVQKLADEAVSGKLDDSTLKGLNSLFAKYNLKGTTNNVLDEMGHATVYLKDGSTVKTVGKVEPLSLNNVEDFRQGLNSLIDYTNPRASHSLGILKGELDNSVESILNSSVSGNTPKIAAYEQARNEYKNYLDTWKSKDLLQKILDTRTGTSTDILATEKIGQTILNAPKAEFDKVMSIISKDPVAKDVLKVEMVSSIFDKAATRDASGTIESISGAKLKTALSKLETQFPNRLKGIISNYDDFIQLVNLIEDATVPLRYTQNPSGTAFKLIKSMGNIAPMMSGGIVGGWMGAAAAQVGKSLYDFKQAEKILAPMIDQTKLAEVYVDAMRKASVSPTRYETAMKSYMEQGTSVLQTLLDFGEVAPIILAIRIAGATKKDKK